MKKMIYILLPLLLVSSLYALPKKIQADRYLLQAKKSIENKDHKKAIEYFEKILALDVKVPNSFHYHYAKSLEIERNYESCVKHLDIFLTNGGDKTKFYTKALDIYTKCEENKRVIFHNDKEYIEIKSPHTGKVWLDRNIGASKVCESSTDESCYGNYYTWDESMDICPNGFSLPSINQLKAETINIGVKNEEDAFNSFLKLPLAGYHDGDNGSLNHQGSYGYIWSSSLKGKSAWYLYFDDSYASTNYDNRADGLSVRCLKN